MYEITEFNALEKLNLLPNHYHIIYVFEVCLFMSASDPVYSKFSKLVLTIQVFCIEILTTDGKIEFKFVREPVRQMDLLNIESKVRKHSNFTKLFFS